MPVFISTSKSSDTQTQPVQRSMQHLVQHSATLRNSHCNTITTSVSAIFTTLTLSSTSTAASNTWVSYRNEQTSMLYSKLALPGLGWAGMGWYSIHISRSEVCLPRHAESKGLRHTIWHSVHVYVCTGRSISGNWTAARTQLSMSSVVAGGNSKPIHELCLGKFVHGAEDSKLGVKVQPSC